MAAEVQEMLLSETLYAPDGIGIVWMAQVLPSQASAKGKDLNAEVLLPPTATQLAGEMHETPDRPLVIVVGAGVSWIVQEVPSQCSASGIPPLGPCTVPTAVQLDADVQEIELRPLPVAGGVGTMVHGVAAAAGAAENSTSAVAVAAIITLRRMFVHLPRGPPGPGP
jgi:hypothetical protein